MSCEVCKGAEFVNVEAVPFVRKGDDGYERPSCHCFHARYCPMCGDRMPEHNVRIWCGDGD